MIACQDLVPWEGTGEEVVVVADAQALAQEAAQRFAGLACEAAKRRGRFCAALSGGTTPGSLYRLLAEEPYRSRIPWIQVHLFWADERSVPADHPASNYRLVQEALLVRVPVRAVNVHRVRGELGAEEAARRYDRELRRFFGGLPPRWDLVLLGVGRDGHTASLFPGSAALEEKERLSVAASGLYDDRPAERVTLTLPALNAAEHVLFLVSGCEKAEVVQSVLTDADGRLPARRICLASGRVTWIVDAAAAALTGELGARLSRCAPSEWQFWDSPEGAGGPASG
ncbi:MAG TPA: 6-phosphogluconolactonase [Anaerolineae bacterium]|nr:6-phosphogluconolactonase [Anaerolineae bacterium]